MLNLVLKQYNQMLLYKSSLNRIYLQTVNETFYIIPVFYKLTNLL